MIRTNKEKLTAFILLRSHYEKSVGTMQANIEAYKTLSKLTKSLDFENIKRLYEQTELCVIKEAENERKNNRPA